MYFVLRYHKISKSKDLTAITSAEKVAILGAGAAAPDAIDYKVKNLKKRKRGIDKVGSGSLLNEG